MNTVLAKIFNIPVYLLLFVTTALYIIAAAFMVPQEKKSDDEQYNILNHDFDTYIWPVVERFSILINLVSWFLLVKIIFF